MFKPPDDDREDLLRLKLPMAGVREAARERRDDDALDNRTDAELTRALIRDCRDRREE
jgi:hypothetical protein